MTTFYLGEYHERHFVAAHTLVPAEQVAAQALVEEITDPDAIYAAGFSEAGWMIHRTVPELEMTKIGQILTDAAGERAVREVPAGAADKDLLRYIGRTRVTLALFAGAKPPNIDDVPDYLAHRDPAIDMPVKSVWKPETRTTSSAA